MSKLLVKWTPETGSAREWTVDLIRPAWDLRYQTEVATGWPWETFVNKLGEESAIALRALLYTLRRRDETRLSIEAVTIEPGELDFDDVPEPAKPKKSKGDTDTDGGTGGADGAAKGEESGEA